MDTLSYIIVCMFFIYFILIILILPITYCIIIYKHKYLHNCIKPQQSVLYRSEEIV